jgi:hypothetical protein
MIMKRYDIWGGYNKIALAQGMDKTAQVNVCLPIWVAIDRLAVGCVAGGKQFGDALLSAIHFVDVAFDRSGQQSAAIKARVQAAFDAMQACYDRIDGGGIGQLFIDEKKAVVSAVRVFDSLVSQLPLYECKDIVSEVKRKAFTTDAEPVAEPMPATPEQIGIVTVMLVMQVIEDAGAAGISELSLLGKADRIISGKGLRFNSKEALKVVRLAIENGDVRVEVKRVGVSKPKNHYFYADKSGGEK